jgi:hypothetical protein
MTGNNLAILFEEEPKQWGLRGDQFLWREMKDKIMSKEVSTVSDFAKVIEGLFEELTQCKPENDTEIYIERYNLGGMSGGYVSPEFWLEKAFPMLSDRFLELYNKKGKDSN